MNIILAIHALIEYEKRFLLLRRSSQEKYKTGFWELPGGKLKFGETPIITLKREIREEIGIEIDPIKIINLYTSNDNPNTQHFQAIYYCSTKNTKLDLNLREHDMCKWIKEEEFNSLTIMDYVKDTVIIHFHGAKL